MVTIDGIILYGSPYEVILAEPVRIEKGLKEFVENVWSELNSGERISPSDTYFIRVLKPADEVVEAENYFEVNFSTVVFKRISYSCWHLITKIKYV